MRARPLISLKLKERLRRLLPHVPFAGRLPFVHSSYAQEGEDRLLARYFSGKRNGFYVDVGAHHPFRFSNTYLFYRMGWKGINIDALPGGMASFKRTRSKDINIEAGVGSKSGSAKFYIFNDPALNTFDEDYVHAYSKPPFSVERIIEIPIKPLYEILDENLPPSTRIDLLSVDVEGRDLEVLQSNNWRKYRPHVVLAECTEKSIENLSEEPIVQFLNQNDYTTFAKTVNTLMFVDRSSI